jgi:hypothetical protein
MEFRMKEKNAQKLKVSKTTAWLGLAHDFCEKWLAWRPNDQPLSKFCNLNRNPVRSTNLLVPFPSLINLTALSSHTNHPEPCKLCV